MKTIIEMAEDVGAYVADLPLEDAVLFEVDILSGRSAKLEAFAALVAAAEREAIYDQWHSCVMADLENGVRWLNEKAAAEWHKNYPAQSNLFPAWIEARGQA